MRATLTSAFLLGFGKTNHAPPPEDRSLGFACRDLMRTLPRRGSDVLHDSSNNTTADGRVRKEKKERSSICIGGHVLTETGDRCLL